MRVLMPSPDREAHDGYLEKYCRTGKRTIIGSGREVTALQKIGEIIPIHLSLSEAQVSGRRVFVGMCRDITELVRARAELQAAHLRSDAVLDTAADGILTIDGEGIVQSFNKAAEKLFGYTKSEMVGQSVKRLMPASTAAQHGDYLKQALEAEEPKATGMDREVLAQRRNGTTFPAWLSVSRFRIGQTDFVTGIIRDVSELRQKQSELQDLNRQLSYRGWFSERQLELNDVVRGASNLAEACQLLTGTLVKQTQAVSAVSYLAEEPASRRLLVAAGHAFPSATKSGTSVELGEGLLGQAVREGKTRLVNLESGQFAIGSAFEHLTPRLLAIGPLVYNDVTVGAFELALESRPEAQVMRYLENLPALCGAILGAIRDQERIRELLAQSRAQTEELRAQPRARKTGSKSTLPPPALEAEPERISETRKDGANAGAPMISERILVGKTVLIVDDDLRNVFALRALLGSVGMHVVVAENGLEAVEQFSHRTDIDCVLMDIMMPHMDGYAAIGRLRALPRGAPLPIVALTAKTMPNDRQRCLEAGATDYLGKPTNKDALLGCLRIWLTT